MSYFKTGFTIVQNLYRLTIVKHVINNYRKRYNTGYQQNKHRTST